MSRNRREKELSALQQQRVEMLARHEQEKAEQEEVLLQHVTGLQNSVDGSYNALASRLKASMSSSKPARQRRDNHPSNRPTRAMTKSNTKKKPEEEFKQNAEDGDLDALKQCFAAAKSIVKQRSLIEFGSYAAFIAAASSGHNDIVTYILINFQASLITRMTRSNSYKAAFKAACEYGHADVVTTMLEKVASPTSTNMIRENNFQVFTAAAENQHPEVMQVIWRFGKQFQHKLGRICKEMGIEIQGKSDNVTFVLPEPTVNSPR